MTKITTLQEISKEIIGNSEKLVIAGGCFDILHEGHKEFLKMAKEQGNVLIILLENDQNIRETKGENRPENNQEVRALNLAALNLIDYIIPLPYMKSNEDYDKVILRLKPDIIATTLGDPYRNHKERQAKLINGKVVDVIKRLSQYSTTNILKTYE